MDRGEQMISLRRHDWERARTASSGNSQRGFTLIEMLVSATLLVMIMVALSSVLGIVSRSYQTTMGKLDSFESARAAFDLVTRTTAQATLMSYLGCDDPELPSAYQLKSDLHFSSGPQSSLGLTATGAESSHAIFFQAPLGVVDSASLQNANLLLVSTGFFIAYGDDPIRPAVLDGKIKNRRRYRLFQFVQPRENMTVYQYTIKETDGIPVSDETFKGPDWFQADVGSGKFCRPLAENIIFMAILPVTGGKPADNYVWNSRDEKNASTHHRLPQSLKLVLAVIDEKSASRLNDPETAPAFIPEDLFTIPAEYNENIKTLGTILTKFKPALDYRIFTAEIPLNASNSNL